jgi:ribosomal protein S18 acetylase RimI-like enzyme
MPFLTRHATEEDAEVVHDIIQAAFAEYRGTIPVPPGALSETVEEVRARVAEGRTLILYHGAEHDNPEEAAGTAAYEPREGYLYVGRVAVLPQWRHRGVGRKLMGTVEEMAPIFGLSRLRLGTRESMRSNVAFYERLGYRIVERQPHSRGPDVILWFEKELERVDP